MSLKYRFILITASLIFVSTLIALLTFYRSATDIIDLWGQRIAEIQVRYDSARLSRPLEREIALAQQFASSSVMQRWSEKQNDPELTQQAELEMESYRQSFRDNNFFVAFVNNGAYYHNNAANEYQGELLRYTLDPDDPKDAWFYQLVETGRDFHLNVNPDPELGVTMLWIDVLIRNPEGKILGVVGAGLELERFLRDIVDIGQPGITSLFLDGTGAIQLYRDQNLIDFASLVKPEGQKNTLDLLLDTEADRQAVRQHMQTLRQPGQSGVETVFVTRNGVRHLLGIAYLPSLDWFEVTLIDLQQLMPIEPFLPIIALVAILLMASLVVIYLLLNHWFLRPMQQLTSAMQDLRDGHYQPEKLPKGQGEVGRLIRFFGEMAQAIRRHTDELEDRVRERTQQLETLARIDPLTNLFNRRGLTDIINTGLDRARRSNTALGILWIDLDHFKALNDSQGHAVGDQALIEIADVLHENLRAYDQAARWGGDEFLIVMADCDANTLTQLGERIRLAVEEDMQEQGWPITVSIGGYLTRPADSVDSLLNRADQAMYHAKQGGKNRFYRTPN
ncbi:MAG: diguanylate cyclase [Pseudohongiellaceae bacterium]